MFTGIYQLDIQVCTFSSFIDSPLSILNYIQGRSHLGPLACLILEILPFGTMKDTGQKELALRYEGHWTEGTGPSY
jgi:hypothetical protein